jgi:hypothetical protein
MAGYVGADPDRLDAISQQILGHAQLLDELRATLTAQLFDAGWVGDDALAAQSEWESLHATSIGQASALLRQMSDSLTHNAAQQRTASAADGTSASLGGIPPQPGTIPGRSEGGGDRRDPDGRDGRRLRNDEIFRRSEGGDRGGGHTDNDWAGRAILDRYLTGGDDWNINDDPDWSRYMMNNQSLKSGLTEPVQVQAQNALDRYLAGQGADGSFDQTMHAEMENGEGVVGYQYLHGTSSDAGDFQFSGNTRVNPLPDGTYEVVIDGAYTWNDTIDPNPQYSTDQWKSKVAEVITLGKADPYDIHITWHAQTRVIMDAQGNVIRIEGYPAQ